MPVLTTAEKITIATILQVTPQTVFDQVTSLTISTELETAIRTELTRWETSGSKFTRIEPNGANYGAKIDPELAKSDIRMNIAQLLDMTYWMSYGSSIGTLQIGL